MNSFIIKNNVWNTLVANEDFLFKAILFLAAIIFIYILYAYKKHQKKYNDLSNNIDYYRSFIEHTSDTIYFILSKSALSFNIGLLINNLPEEFHLTPDLFKSLVHPDDLDRLETILKTPPADAFYQLNSFRLSKPDKSFDEFELKLIPIPDKNKMLSSFYGILRKSEANQEQLCDISHLNRLKTIGQMASSVAHEIKNPLTTVKGYLQLFSKKEDFSKYKEQFELIITELDRTNLIIEEYLFINPNKISNPKLCNLNNIINSLYPLLKAFASSINKDITLDLGNIPELYVDENEIRQLILNIVKNGLESMKDIKDRITVNISTYIENNNAFLSIRDQGEGISPIILANIGTAFFTTKDQGSGLGLMICYKIAAKHKAKIAVDTSPNGTAFFIQFALPQTGI